MSQISIFFSLLFALTRAVAMILQGLLQRHCWPGPVYGLFLCRGDQTTSGCQNCVTYATGDVTQRCPDRKVTVIWYDECPLRYSNQFFFSSMDTEPAVSMYNTQNVTDQGRFNEQVASLMNESVTQAVNNPKKFAVRKTNFTALQTLYSIAQCTPDLSSSLCDTCLRTAIAQLPNCCSGSQGGRVLSPSCNVRYELYPFYNETVAEPPAPPPALLSPPPPGSVTRPRVLAGNRRDLGSRTEGTLPAEEFECSDKSTSKSIPWSVDEASITEVYPR